MFCINEEFPNNVSVVYYWHKCVM